MDKNLDYFTQKKLLYELISVIGYIIIGISFFLWIPLGTSSGGKAIPILLIGIIGGGIISGISTKYFKNLSNEFKSKYLPAEIKKIYPNCIYNVTKGFTKEEIYHSKVLRQQDRYHSEDFMSGEFEGVQFESADVNLQDVRSNGKSTTVVTVFLGRVYKFEFNKPFKSNILINQPSFFYHLFGWNRIKTESKKFNSELSIYSDNEHDAFYILTPHFMERLLVLDRKYHDKISFSFINNQLYIAINTNRDTFDLKMFHPLDLSILQEYRNELNDIKEFVYQLNLDKTLFLDNK
ncbi:DUF3137 domain-containing protein [Mycoplasmatota bacterium]|nr:DUF3137 domain-containing protein [Mycoplasmatota bacterium]